MRGQNHGFTLIELLLTLALASILVGVSLPASRHLLVRNDLAAATTLYRQTLRRAQHLAKQNQYNSNWGVRVEPGAVIMFQGSSFSSRNSSFDERYEISPSLQISGSQETVFARVSGTTTATSTTLTSNLDTSSEIRVSSRGVVE